MIAEAPDPAVFRWMDDEGEIHELEVTGHLMMVRKMAKSEDDFLVGPEGEMRGHIPAFCMQQADAILATLTDKTHQNFCEVLAVGPLCNTLRTKVERKRMGLPPNFYNPSRVGDIVLLPERSGRGLLWNNITGKLYDILVDECEVIAIIPQEQLEMADAQAAMST